MMSPKPATRAILWSLLLVWTTTAGAPRAGAADAAPAVDQARAEFFEARIRPLLSEHCYRCHSARAEKLKGGLRLDDRDALLKGGDSGPAIVPGLPSAAG